MQSVCYIFVTSGGFAIVLNLQHMLKWRKPEKQARNRYMWSGPDCGEGGCPRLAERRAYDNVGTGFPLRISVSTSEGQLKEGYKKENKECLDSSKPLRAQAGVCCPHTPVLISGSLSEPLVIDIKYQMIQAIHQNQKEPLMLCDCSVVCKLFVSDINK